MSTKGLKDLEKQLKQMQNKLKKYDGTHQVELHYSKEQWDNMTEAEKSEAIEEAKNSYIEEIKKDIFE